MDEKNKNILNSKKSNQPDFKIPDAYFENFEASLFKKMSISDSERDTNDLRKMSLIRNEGLSAQKREHGFKVPEGYFEKTDFRLDTQERNSKHSPKVRTLRLLSMSVAASILLFFGIKFVNKGTTGIDSSEVVLQNDEIAGWVADDLVYFDTYEIAEAFGDIQLEQNMYTEDAVNDYLDFVDIESLMIEN